MTQAYFPFIRGASGGGRGKIIRVDSQDGSGKASEVWGAHMTFFLRLLALSCTPNLKDRKFALSPLPVACVTITTRPFRRSVQGTGDA